MDSNQPTYPDAAARIMNLVQSVYGPAGNIIHGYSLGVPDPNNILLGKDAFPYIIVDKTGGTYSLTNAPTSTDDVTEHVYIHILVDAVAGLGAPESVDTVKRQLQLLIEGRDPTTGYLLPNTLMYGLRTYVTLQSQVAPGIITINSDISISYDNPPRPNMAETREAVIDITVKERQVMLNRR